MGQYILALNQGVTKSKATCVDNRGKVLAQTEYPLKPIFLKSGWVEYRPDDILKSQINAIKALFLKIGSKKRQITGIGITNQPSTIVMWDKYTGKPLYNAIARQDQRGSDICSERLDHGEYVRDRTGLPLSSYYSASKIKWLLENVKPTRKLLEKGGILCGTINTYLLWHLTQRTVYAIDHTNAAQTLLFNIFTRSWDKELLELFGIPPDILPAILPTSHLFGDAVIDGQSIPVHASIAEHQATLIGNGCFQEGEASIEYGSNGSVLINTGKKIFNLPGLLTTVAWSNNENTVYLLEGTLNAVGSIFDWLRSNLGILSTKDNIDDICRRSEGQIFMLPAISGIGSPHWNTNTATCLFGLRSTTTREDIIRSAVESIAFLVKDNFNILEKDGRLQVKKIITSGPLSEEVSYLLQFQSDLLHAPLHKVREGDPSLRGGAFLAGLNLKMWHGFSSIEKLLNTKKAFNPKRNEADVKALYERWRLTCLYSKEWSKNFS